MNATDDKVAYMRDYRKRYRETEEGREKLREGKRHWKKSENGKKYNREWAKKKYVPSDRVLKTDEENRDRRRKYWHMIAKPKSKRYRQDKMRHLERYKLTKEQYLAMLASQGGGCAICGVAKGGGISARVLCVDHCHNTGKIRGLLCDNCNRGIGALKDDAGLLRKALLYLETYHG